MSSVVISGDTSGAITLAAPAVSGTNTATLPAATGTVMVSGNMPAFSAYQSSAQTIGSGTYTKLQFQTEEYDTANAFDSATNYRFTPTVAGYYAVDGGVGIGTGSGVVIVLYKNGTTYKNIGNTYGLVSYGCYGAGQVYLNGSTDYIELYVFLVVGQAISTGAGISYFQASMIRTA